MKISKNKLKDLINEELKRESLQQQKLEEVEMYAAHDAIPPSSETSNTSSGGEITDLGNLMDASGGELKAIENNVQIISRLLEKIPFDAIQDEYLQACLVEAAQSVRDALDEIADIHEEEEHLKSLELQF